MRPNATVGIPSIALKNPLINLLPGKDEIPSTIAIGNPHKHESNVANPDIEIDLRVIENTSWSPLKISLMA